MKQLVIIFSIIVMATVLHGQTPNANEVLRQKNTQRKYSANQVIALKAYLEVLKKGYTIVQKGLDEVGASKNGTYLRDQQYFNSLKDVNAIVRSSPRIKEIYTGQQKVRDNFLKLVDDCRRDKNFTASEIGYIGKVYTNMIRECELTLDELMLAATSATEMTDADRLQRLDRIAESMQDKSAFTQSFIASTRGLSANRTRERIQAETLRKLYSKP